MGGKDSDSKAIDWQKELDDFRSNYPDIDFALDESKKRKAILVKNRNGETKRDLRFESPNQLRFMLLNLNGFKSISFPESKACLIVEGRFFGLISFSDRRYRHRLSKRKFSFHYQGQEFEVTMAPWNFRDLRSAIPFLKEDTDVRKNKKSYDETVDWIAKQVSEIEDEELPEEHASYKATIPSREDLHIPLYALMIGFLDRGYQNLVSPTITLTSPNSSVMMRLGEVPRTPFDGIPRRPDSDAYLLIEGRSARDAGLLAEKCSEIADSIFFNYYYTTGVLPYFLRLRSELRPRRMRKRIARTPTLPLEETHRRVDSTLMQYLLVAETTNSPTFRYLSFYHTLEYFFERVVVQRVADEIRRIVLKPDFLSRRELYTSQIVRIAQETPKVHGRLSPEALKLMLVLRNLLSGEFLKQLPADLKDYLSQPVDFGEGHSLEPVIFQASNEQKSMKDKGKDLRRVYDRRVLYSTLTQRIYELRCSIVHSNPDFSKRQKPLELSPSNLEKVEREAELLRMIACEVISEASNLQII